MHKLSVRVMSDLSQGARQSYEMSRWSDRDRGVSLYRRTAALGVTLI